MNNFRYTNLKYAKAHRLRKRKEFVSVSTRGIKVQNRHFIGCFIPNHRPTSRLGITTTKRIGTAVKRNSIKRRTREYFRVHRHRLLACLDINVIAKKESADLTSAEIFISLEQLFHQIERHCDH